VASQQPLQVADQVARRGLWIELETWRNSQNDPEKSFKKIMETDRNKKETKRTVRVHLLYVDRRHDGSKDHTWLKNTR